MSVPSSTPDGSIRKTVKSKLFKAAVSDLSVVTDEDLPDPDRLRTYFFDLELLLAVKQLELLWEMQKL